MSTAGSLLVSSMGIVLPVTVRDTRLRLVVVGSTNTPINLPAGRYAVLVPLPGSDDLDGVVEIESGGRLRVVAAPVAPGLDALTAAIALVEQGRPDAGLHVLRNAPGGLTLLGDALLGFTALQLGEVDTATEVAVRIGVTTLDGIALRAALLRHRSDVTGTAVDPDRLADSAERVLGSGPPQLRAAAFALIALFRTVDRPPSEEFGLLVALVRRCAPGRVLLVAPVALPALRRSETALAAENRVRLATTFGFFGDEVLLEVRDSATGGYRAEITAPADRPRCFVFRLSDVSGWTDAIAALVVPQQSGTPNATVNLPAAHGAWSVEEMPNPAETLTQALITRSREAAADRSTRNAWHLVEPERRADATPTAPPHTIRRQATRAVIPVAGPSDQFLPATIAVPKELLPLVDRPILQYLVEEAASAGITDILIITTRDRDPVVDHFDRHPELEDWLLERGELAALAAVRRTSELAEIYVRTQPEPLGVGNAVAHSASHAGEEPIAVLLGDEIVGPDEPLLARMLELQGRTGGVVIALVEVEPSATRQYEIASVEPADDGLEDLGEVVAVTGIIERPHPANAPSTLALIGRYVLPSSVFDAIDRTKPRDGEIQLVEAIAMLLAEGEQVHGVIHRGEHYDTGHPLGYLQAVVKLASGRDDLGPEFQAWLRHVVATQRPGGQG